MLHEFKDDLELTHYPDNQRPTQVRIQLRIPKDYHQEPVISRLIADYGITVNINGAILSANACDDGWFDLELRGQERYIKSALIYLNDLDLDIWNKSDADHEGW